MSEEEKKAIEILSLKAITSSIEAPNYPNAIVMKRDLITILNLIEKQNIIIKRQSYTNKKLRKTLKTVRKERNKQNKIIYKMAERLAEDKEWFYSEFDNYTKQDFIEYFTNKVEEDK